MKTEFKGENLSGRKFGKLTVTGIGRMITRPNGVRLLIWDCVCECGKSTDSLGSNLKRGNTKSCGCLKLENKGRPPIHSHASRHNPSKTYQAWDAMKQRCLNPENESYSDYGGRGVCVCERWLKFEPFLEDMGVAPPGLSIERVNNSGNYEPGNCVWATKSVQNRNKRDNIRIEMSGKTQTVTDWAIELGINRQTIYARLYHKWNPIEALTTPVQQRR